MAKRIAPREIGALMPKMTMTQLRKAYEQDCGCGSSCRARTGQEEHGLCFYHERLADEIKRRMDRPSSLHVSRTTAEQDGSCNSCQGREGTMMLIELKNTSFRLCQACLTELGTLLKTASEKGK